MTDHPITPPPELVQQWDKGALGTHCRIPPYGYSQFIANLAAQWAADQELEACIADIHTLYGKGSADWLRSMRRPSLKEQAQAALLRLANESNDLASQDSADMETIRRALEQLDD
jgi:hypothetical protein